MATPTQKRLNRTVEEINPLLDKLDEGYTKAEIDTLLEDKVDKETGKGLSTNDYTTAEKTKLDNLAEIKTVGTGLNLDDNGELTATGGGTGGTTNYNDLSNKPQINGNTLSGNKTSAQLGLASASDIPTTLADLSDDSTHRTVSDTEKATWNAKADAGDIPTVPITAIQKNGTGITPISGTVNITVPTSAADISALPDTTKYAVALSLTINSSTFVMTGQLKDQNGDNLGTAQTIDLPLESVVVGGSYNSQTKKVVLTLQNGNTIEFSVADLVSGLQTELSASNKLNPAYINYDSTHRAVSDTEKSTWNGKQNAIDSSHKLSADLVDDTSTTNKFATVAELEQIQTNKNNISSVQEQANWNSNSGVKNKLNYTGYNGTSTSAGVSPFTTRNVTYKKNADDTISVYTTNAGASGNAFCYLCDDNSAINFKQYFDGKHILSCDVYSAYHYALFYKIDGEASVAVNGDTLLPNRNNITNAYIILQVYSGEIISESTPIVFNPMIRLSSISDSTYQPHAMSNAELTAAIQALQAQLANQ